jgi:Zn-dependent protease
MGGGWRIGRIAGTEVRIDPSLLVIAGLLIYSRWVDLSNPRIFPGTGAGLASALAVAGAFMFFASILLHELAHAAVARARHIQVDGITLWMFGGATHARIDSRGPLDEFLIAVVGPGTSLAIGAVLVGMAHLLSHGPVWFVVDQLGRLNVLLAVFNVLPGFPLDGGRILRSIVWSITRNLSTATVVAARVGQVFGAGFLGYGLSQGLSHQDYSQLWLAFIGFMLMQAATATLAQERRLRRLNDTLAGAVMKPPPAAIPGDMPVSQARATYLDGRTGAFPVIDGGHVVGFVSAATLDGVLTDRPIREVVTSSTAAITVAPTETVRNVLGHLQEARATIALVMDSGRLVGVIGEDDVAALLGAGTPARSS